MNRIDRARPETLRDLIGDQCRRAPHAIALLGVDRRPLSYADLSDQIDHVVSVLDGVGIRRDDRVAVVLPNGPEMAAAFLGVASGATCAPLDAASRRAEFDVQLAALHPKAVIVDSRRECAARDAAGRLGLPLLEVLVDAGAPAGRFRLTGGMPRAARPDYARMDDIALALHTSGTTSRPKLVPLSHRNLCASAFNVAGALELTAEDRCLNVMPLFHIHGLVGALLSSCAAGASIFCSPGFDEERIFEWLADGRPTWYTAVPTIHQAVLAAAERDPSLARRSSLRLIRSSSASMPPRVMARLESLFGVPVIESYGMTEAAHQMSSNRLPPGRRKPGSVGVPSGPEMAVMDADGTLVPAGELGEIVIRGDNVMSGYDANPAANEQSFSHGWFRTGDQGRCDEDGFFYLTGRLKEIINRGGEKIAPREVDEALLEHPSVTQAVTFAVPHPRLGEDIATAVVLRPGASVSEQELRGFVFGRVADHKVPSRIVSVNAIPKGPTGKLQRIGLHEQLRALLDVAFVEPTTATGRTLAAIWSELLSAPAIGAAHNFFSCGGDSLLAVRVVARIRTALDIEVPVADVFRYPTLGELAGAIDARRCEAQRVHDEHLTNILDEIERLSETDAQRLLDE